MFSLWVIIYFLNKGLQHWTKAHRRISRQVRRGQLWEHPRGRRSGGQGGIQDVLGRGSGSNKLE